MKSSLFLSESSSHENKNYRNKVIDHRNKDAFAIPYKKGAFMGQEPPSTSGNQTLSHLYAYLSGPSSKVNLITVIL